ncbi:MAG: hypothetical protein HZB52_06505 [Chloroflexi bacterium]|nr:hypothetical protein [Chloroflexota bacterium]
MKTTHIFLALTFLLSTQTPEPPQPKPDPRFGAVESYYAPHIAKQANIGWDRMIINWFARQPNGDHQWNVPPEEKERIAAAEKDGREIVALLMNTPHWATDGKPAVGVPRGLYLAVDNPGNLWANFVRRIVKEYKGRITHWIIWNEPDIALEDFGAQFEGTVEDYYQLVKVAYLVAKETDPDAVIHLGGMTYWHDLARGRPPYLQRFLDVALKDDTAIKNNFYFDVFTTHIYFRTETVADIIRFYKQMMWQYGINKSIWLNETNAAPYDDPRFPANPLVRVTMNQQAAFIIQATALALAAGAERIAIYKLFDETASAPGYESYGLYRNDESPRPAAHAYRAVTTHFARTQSAYIFTQYDYHLVTLNRQDGITRVAWSRIGRETKINLYLGATAKLYDHLGRELPTQQNGYTTLTLPAGECEMGYGICDVGGAPLIVVETFAAPAPTPMGLPTLPPLPTATPTP